MAIALTVLAHVGFFGNNWNIISNENTMDENPPYLSQPAVKPMTYHMLNFTA